MITTKQRAELRGLANNLDDLFQIGKGGISDTVVSQVEEALVARELIKIKALLESVPETPRALADALSEKTGADVIQVIGGVIVLYRENPELRQQEKEKAKRKKEAEKKRREKERAEKRAKKFIKKK